MAEMSTTYISTLPTGSAGGSKYLVQDDGNNTTKVTVNDAVASATAVTSANSSISSINTKIGSTTLPTTAQTLTGAIAEHESDITALNSNIGQSFAVRFKTGTVSIPDGSSSSASTVSISTSDIRPTGYNAYAVMVSIGINQLQLPYVDASTGETQTWIRAFGNDSITLYNTTTGWGSRTYYVVVIYRKA